MPKNLPLKANDLQDKESRVSTSPKKERIMMACKGNSVLEVESVMALNLPAVGGEPAVLRGHVFGNCLVNPRTYDTRKRL
jgi:hypothetical protein